MTGIGDTEAERAATEALSQVQALPRLLRHHVHDPDVVREAALIGRPGPEEGRIPALALHVDQRSVAYAPYPRCFCGLKPRDIIATQTVLRAWRLCLIASSDRACLLNRD